MIEAKITVTMEELASAVGVDDAEKVKEIADELIVLDGDRNNNCKVLNQKWGNLIRYTNTRGLIM